MPTEEIVRKIKISTNRQVYYILLGTVRFVNTGFEPMFLKARFIDKNNETGMIFLTPKLEFIRVEYDVPY